MKKSITRIAFAIAAGALFTLPHGCQGGGAPVEGSVIKDPREVPAPIARTAPQIVHVDLTAKEIVAELAPGRTFRFFTFNGTVPGPMIRAMEGDTVEITLTNALGNHDEHNLDLHASVGPGGGAAVTSIKPGETATFRFLATRRGAYIYHCAGEGMPWEHVGRGMFGLIQIDPPGGLEPGFKELYLGQSEWYAGDASEDDKEGKKSVAPSMGLDLDKAYAEQPTFYSFNGHTKALAKDGPLAHAMTVQQGDKVRLFFVNAGPNKTSSFHVIGGLFDKVYTGHPDDALRNEETVSVPPGSALVAELTATVPGAYTIVDHALFRVPRGALATLHVLGAGPWPTDLYSPEATGDGH